MPNRVLKKSQDVNKKGANKYEAVRTEKMTTGLNESNNPTDQLRVRVMTEYFSMIEELLLVADQRMTLITNNFSPQVWKNVVKLIRNRFKVKALQFADNADNLEAIFVNGHSDPMYCGEDTLFNLFSLFSIFDYQNTKKLQQGSLQKEKKIDKVLSVLEKLQNTTKLNTNQVGQEPIVGFMKDFKKIIGSVRGIDFKSKNKIVIHSD